MIGGVTRRGLPHQAGAPHLHVNRETAGLIRNGLPQLTYYNKIWTELYKQKSN